MGITFKVEGLKDVYAAFEQLAADIGDKNAKSKVLIPAAREAMQPVLIQAKTNAPVDTGALSNTLIVEARRPTKRDMRSKYITQSDTVIAAVTTKAFPKKIRGAFFKENQALYESDKEAYQQKFKALTKQLNFPYDARAIAQEFGTAKMKGHKPFLRPAMESQSQQTVRRLGEILARRINQYRAKQK
jgi:HK97 gp10 family phage protein